MHKLNHTYGPSKRSFGEVLISLLFCIAPVLTQHDFAASQGHASV